MAFRRGTGREILRPSSEVPNAFDADETGRESSTLTHAATVEPALAQHTHGVLTLFDSDTNDPRDCKRTRLAIDSNGLVTVYSGKVELELEYVPRSPNSWPARSTSRSIGSRW